MSKKYLSWAQLRERTGLPDRELLELVRGSLRRPGGLFEAHVVGEGKNMLFKESAVATILRIRRRES